MNGERDEQSSTGATFKVTRNNNVKVSVECPAEARITEITFDGREIIQPPISKGEKLYRNACKLDFRKEDVKDGPTDELVSIGVEESRERDTRQTRSRPDASTVVWSLDAVRHKLRTALTEVSVLYDVIALSKERRYIRAEPVHNEPMDAKPHFSMHYKKKALANVATILTNAADRLKRSASDAAALRRSENDYHVALIKLRDHWRLKKQGQHVSGDLSYRTNGSSLKGAGQFEIRRNDEDDEKPIDVIIAGDLSGESCIQVDVSSPDFPAVTKDYAEKLRSEDVWAPVVTINNPWHRMLVSAQNSLYCREIIMLMSAEAMNLPDHSPSPIVFSDEIHYTSLNGNQIRVKLVQILDGDRVGSTKAASTQQQMEECARGTLAESRVLEFSLSMMLLQRMRDLSNPDLPIPACGPVGLKIFRRKMAIQARDRRVWKLGTAGRSLTAELLERTKALLLRKRCLKFASELYAPDLVVTVHDCSPLTSWRNMMIKMVISTTGYDSWHKTSCAFMISCGQVSFVTKEYQVPLNSDDDLDCHLLYMEIVRQHAAVLQYLLKSHRFQIMHYSPYHNYYKLDDKPESPSLAISLRYAVVLIAKSSDDRWLIKVVCSVRYVYRIYVAKAFEKSAKTTVIRDAGFLPQDFAFREVDLNKISGGQLRINRIASMLGYLTSLEEGTELQQSQNGFPSPSSSLGVLGKLKRHGSPWTNWQEV